MSVTAAHVHDPDQVTASARAKAEHPFLLATRDPRFTSTRSHGLAKNHDHPHLPFASATWPMPARAVALTG